MFISCHSVRYLMAVAQTGGRIEAGHLLGYLHTSRLASVRWHYYFHEPRYRLQVFKIYEVDGMVNLHVRANLVRVGQPSRL